MRAIDGLAQWYVLNPVRLRVLFLITKIHIIDLLNIWLSRLIIILIVRNVKRHIILLIFLRRILSLGHQLTNKILNLQGQRPVSLLRLIKRGL